MQDGSIRVNRVNKNNFRDMSDYWILPMHDNQNGYVSKMCFSCDEKYFFSCGHDGNIFAYTFHPEEGYIFPNYPEWEVCSRFEVCIRDVDTYTKLSLEEMKIKIENDRVQKKANEYKAGVKDIVRTLKEKYIKLLLKNSKLLPSQMISKEDLDLDARVTEHIDSKFKSKLELLKKKLAYDVEKSECQMKKLLEHFINPMDIATNIVKAINKPDLFVVNLRQRVITKEFYEMLDIIKYKLIEEEVKGRSIHISISLKINKKNELVSDISCGCQNFVLILL